MSPENKNIALVIGFLLMLVLCYRLAFSKTLALRTQYDRLQRKEKRFENTPKQLSSLSQKKHYYDSLLSKYQLGKGSIQNNLLKNVNAFAEKHHLKVVDFLQPHVLKNNGRTTKTYRFTLQGGFNGMISLVYHLEQETKFGKIINLHFEKKKNYKTNKHYLQVHILLNGF